MDKLVGYRAADFPEYHQWVAKVLGVSKTQVTISQECDGVLSLIAAVEAGQAPAVVGEFITAVGEIAFATCLLSPSRLSWMWVCSIGKMRLRRT
jgi:hypothetical protein